MACGCAPGSRAARSGGSRADRRAAHRPRRPTRGRRARRSRRRGSAGRAGPPSTVRRPRHRSPTAGPRAASRVLLGRRAYPAPGKRRPGSLAGEGVWCGPVTWCCGPGPRVWSWSPTRPGRGRSPCGWAAPTSPTSDLDDPLRLEFDYVQRIVDVVEAAFVAGERLRTVHVGGAGMTLPRYLAATRPQSAQVVLEPDAELTAFVREQLPLPRTSGIKVRARPTGGGGVPALRDGYRGALVVDAFVGAQVPAELTTVAVVADRRRVVDPDGVLALNVTDSGPLGYARRVVAGSAGHLRVDRSLRRAEHDQGPALRQRRAGGERPAARCRSGRPGRPGGSRPPFPYRVAARGPPRPAGGRRRVPTPTPTPSRRPRPRSTCSGWAEAARRWPAAAYPCRRGVRQLPLGAGGLAAVRRPVREVVRRSLGPWPGRTDGRGRLRPRGLRAVRLP